CHLSFFFFFKKKRGQTASSTVSGAGRCVKEPHLHVHVVFNRVPPERGYRTRLSWSQKNLSRPCRELELKHVFAPNNGCGVHARENRIVRKTAVER
ncbi:hypothetical protein CWI62_27540, partial [Escherichia coli]